MEKDEIPFLVYNIGSRCVPHGNMPKRGEETVKTPFNERRCQGPSSFHLYTACGVFCDINDGEAHMLFHVLGELVTD